MALTYWSLREDAASTVLSLESWRGGVDTGSWTRWYKRWVADARAPLQKHWREGTDTTTPLRECPLKRGWHEGADAKVISWVRGRSRASADVNALSWDTITRVLTRRRWRDSTVAITLLWRCKCDGADTTALTWWRWRDGSDITALTWRRWSDGNETTALPRRCWGGTLAQGRWSESNAVSVLTWRR